MSVNSVLPGLSPSYGPLSGNGSQSAPSAARAKEFPEKTAVTADPSQVTGAAADSTALESSAPTASSTGSTGAAGYQSTLEQALRQGGATADRATSASSESLSDQSPPGLAVYQRVSQYGNNEPSTSALLKRWNSIMRSGGNVDGAAADFAKALAQNETPGLDSGVIDLTA